MDHFSQECAEQIGFYVYALVEPGVESTSELERIFYIGKGKGNRCFAHAKEELSIEELSDEQMKLSTIRAIRKREQEPRVLIIASGFKEEPEAFRLESLLISVLSNLPGLTNNAYGHNHSDYWLPAEALDARYSEPLAFRDMAATVLFVSLNGGEKLPAYPKIKNDPDILSRRTLGAWPVHPRNAADVEYVVGVYRGLTRCVFRVEKTSEGTASFEVIQAKKRKAPRRVTFAGTLERAKENWIERSVMNGRDVVTKFAPQSGCRLVSRADAEVFPERD